jgi:hypothetical protein
MKFTTAFSFDLLVSVTQFINLLAYFSLLWNLMYAVFLPLFDQ